MSDPKILLFGSSGLLGTHIYDALNLEYTLVTVSNISTDSDYQIDATHIESISKILTKEKPDIIINAVKNNLSTDQCELNKKDVWATNVSIPENLIRLQKSFNYRLIHISTDWVYEGKKGEVYTESSIIYPQNFYSFSKAVAEERIIQFSSDFLILRPTGIFGFHLTNKNLFMRVKAAAEANVQTTVPMDQFSQPVSARTLAMVISAAIKKKVQGVYNAVGKTYLSRYDFALLLCDVFDWPKSTIVPIEASSRSIKIPQYLNIDISKCERDITTLPDIKDQIVDLKQQLKGH